MIHFNRDVCSNLDEAIQREWLETNGLGGYASSTIIGLNTRSYHGLLVAATQPPVGRLVLLSKVEETLVIRHADEDEARYELSANHYPGVTHPQGHRYLAQFRLDPFPIFTYEVGKIRLEKAVFMIHGENTVAVQYTLAATDSYASSPLSMSLEVRPLIAFRDHHALTRENASLNPAVSIEPGAVGVVTLTPYVALPTLRVTHNADAIDTTGCWYRNFQYDAEIKRGLNHEEDLFNPFTLTFELSNQKPDFLKKSGFSATAGIIASIESKQHEIAALNDYRLAEESRRKTVRAAAPFDDALVSDLCAAAEQFIATATARGDHKTIIAGYPWFTDWGRDTMIALLGLTLVTGRTDVAKDILLEFARHLDRGMLPNRFLDAGEQPEYNTIDATLWMFEATRALIQYTGDEAWVREHLYEALADVIAWHVRGTRYNIHVDDDGLIYGGAPGVQLTWMDAKVDDWVVTPRHGKPVEIQALWFNALRVMETFARTFGDTKRARDYHGMAHTAQDSFNAQFWNSEDGCLYDVVNDGERDASLRPNQIFAVSLLHSMLPPDRARCVVDVVQRELLTPHGLRSLSPNDPRFVGHYGGDRTKRDAAYHQGTVWAWLMGPFITAYVKVHDCSKESRAQAARWLAGFVPHFSEAGLGQISEIFDGYAPHHPRGCIAQAWSVAELLRAAIEDI